MCGPNLQPLVLQGCLPLPTEPALLPCACQVGVPHVLSHPIPPQLPAMAGWAARFLGAAASPESARRGQGRRDRDAGKEEEGEWWELPESSKAAREGLSINPMEECVSLQSISKRCPPYSARSVAHPGKQTPISGVQRCLLSPPPSQRADQEQCKCSSSSERAWDAAGQSISPGDRCPRAAAPDLIHLPVNLIQTPATKS